MYDTSKEMNAMTQKETIFKRVSQAKFTDQKVNLEHILDCMDIAVYAPNHKMREPWRFILFEGKNKEKFVDNYANEFDESLRVSQKNLVTKVFSAPVVIAVVMPKTGQLRDDLEDVQANAAMIQNLLLLLTESGLSTFWKTPTYIETPLFRSTLELNDHEVITGLLMVGYSDQEIVSKPRKSARSKTTIYS
jgi:nitroreductase